MKTKYFVITLLLYVFCLGCANSTVIKVNSSPSDAVVMLRSIGTTNSEKVGNTPLNISGEELAKKNLKNSHLVLEIQKEGYHTKTVLLTEYTDVDIDLSLNLEPYDKILNAKKYDSLTQQLFEIQRLIRIKSYEEALKITKDLQKDFPELSVTYELEGSIYYLQKDFTKALSAFNSSYAKNNDNTFSLKMKKILEANAAPIGVNK